VWLELHRAAEDLAGKGSKAAPSSSNKADEGKPGPSSTKSG
jgi:hypothetical protein